MYDMCSKCKFEIRRSRLRLGLRPRPRRGNMQHSRLPSCFCGVGVAITSLGTSEGGLYPRTNILAPHHRHYAIWVRHSGVLLL